MKHLRLDSQAVHVAAVRAYLLHHCQDLFFAKSALGALRARDWKKLVEIAGDVDLALRSNGTWMRGSTDVSEPFTPDVFRRCAQFSAMLTKYPYTPEQIPGLDPDAAAIEGFLKDERRNRRINTILRGYRIRGLVRHPAHLRMREWISEVMGHKPDLEYILSHCDYSGGASINVHGKATHFGNKVERPISITPAALEYFTLAVLKNEQLLLHYSAEANSQSSEADWENKNKNVVCLLDYEQLYDFLSQKCDVQQYDLLSCVPKKFDRSRTIGTPQTANTFIQKGVDKGMRRNLRDRANLDLSRQDVNQYMAREGTESTCIPYVTLDVETASNSVLVEVVRCLYSEDWFSFLNCIRSPGCVLPNGESHRYELFVSMGNGFCFPLETSIFAAACVAACKQAGAPVDFRVYGDDIIVRQDVALVLSEILKSLGFRLNLSKSFIHGPFRESCGANWHGGQDVTPAYWRHAITSRSELHAIHNAHKDHPEVQAVLRGFDPELVCCVPDTKQYDWVTDQAFRVTHDLCMGNGAVWRRDTKSFRYRLLVSSTVRDLSLPDDVVWSRLRHISALRGSTYEDAFLLRRSTRQRVEYPDAKRPECEFGKNSKRVHLKAAWKSFGEACLHPPGEGRVSRTHPWVESALRQALTDLRREHRVSDSHWGP